ncbi:MAG: helix-hairpin-helix domain-containing protein [Anaerolineae bacterium]
MGSLLRYRGYIITSLVWIIILGLYVVYDRWPRPETIVIETSSPIPSATVGTILVHVSGAVRNPGVYQLLSDARSQHAIEAAGGLLPDAFPDGLNLAAFLFDGQQVYVPRIGEATVQPSSSNNENRTVTPSAGTPVDVNSATVEQLEELPCFGPTLAARIVAYRQANGPFRSLYDLDQIEGIGPACIEKVRNLLIIQ